MGKIKQGILGGFNGKVGTVIGSSWNGISYMRGIAQSVKNANTAAQQTQRAFFKEVMDLVVQLSNEQLAFLFPNTPQGMTRRNALAKQLATDPIVTDDEKHVDLANIATLGNAPTGNLPDVTITPDGDNIAFSWEGTSVWRKDHADEYPTVFVANVTKKRVFLVNSTAPFGESGNQSFNVGLAAYGEAGDTFSGFMLSTGSKLALVGLGTLSVAVRPARVNKNA